MSSSRVNLLDTPILQPGVCCLCGSSGDGKRKFIDFGKQLDWYGAVYFCSECIREVSEVCEFIPVASFNKLHKEYRELQIKYDQLEVKYRSIDNALRSVFHGDYTICDNRASPIELEKSENTIRLDPESEGGNSKTNESPSLEGSDDLFDSTDFE